MRLKVDGYVLFLGRLRRDGFRNIERVRLAEWRRILPSLRRAKIRSRMVGPRLYVQPDDPNQLKLAFMSEAG